MLDDLYVIVLVGLSEKQIKDLPKNIKGIQRTNSPQELAAIYTAADVLVNSSVEETFGMPLLCTKIQRVKKLRCRMGTPLCRRM